MGVVCPLCGDGQPSGLAGPGGTLYLRCGVCGLTFMEPESRPSAADERAHYGWHRNDPQDEGYRSFLRRLADPLSEVLGAGAEGLDYGSGPGPTLHLIMQERGFPMRIFDPFFAPEADALTRTYDFITCSEVAEHFFSPAGEFERLGGLLRPGGWLGVTTEEMRPGIRLAEWRYARDPTHVSLYHRRTMEWIAGRHGWRLHTPGANVFLFQKPRTPDPD